MKTTREHIVARKVCYLRCTEKQGKHTLEINFDSGLKTFTDFDTKEDCDAYFSVLVAVIERPFSGLARGDSKDDFEREE